MAMPAQLVKDAPAQGAPSTIAPEDTAPATRAKRARQRDILLFQSVASRFFRGVKEDPRHRRMSELHGFHVAPGLGNAGETAPNADEQRMFEVFYGARAIKTPHASSNPRLEKDWRARQEDGATLLYRQGVDGIVEVLVFPAKTLADRPQEDAIYLDRFERTEPLTGDGALQAHWRFFRAYAEVTSIDGEPTFLDRLRVGLMRFMRPTLQDGRRAPARFWKSLGRVLEVAAGVGAAALILGIA